MITSYVQAACQRLTEFGGFAEVELSALPESLGVGAEAFYERMEPGRTTLVALVSAASDEVLVPIRDDLAALGRGGLQQGADEVLVVLVILLPGLLNRSQYERWQALGLQEGSLCLLPWVVDLVRNRLFEQCDPPGDIDSDLALLVAPEPRPVEVPARAFVERSEPHPWVTIALVGLLVLIWLAMTVSGRSLDATEQLPLLEAWGAASRPELWLDHAYWRLLTANFLHIGLLHLVLNALSLWWVGRVVELLFGSWRALYIYLFAGVAGATASAVFGPPLVTSAGASGAIFGLLGAIIWYRLASPLGERVAWRPLLLTVALNLGIGLALADVVDNWNHIGGLTGGLLAAVAVGVPTIQGLPWPRWRLKRPLQAVAAGLLAVIATLVVSGAWELPGAGRDLARSYTAFEEGRLAEAESGFRRAAERQPDEPALHWALAWTYLRAGQCQQAQVSYGQFRSLVPDHPGVAELQKVLQSCGR